MNKTDPWIKIIYNAENDLNFGALCETFILSDAFSADMQFSSPVRICLNIFNRSISTANCNKVDTY